MKRGFYNQSSQRCVLLSCTERKRTDSNLLPAIERYDGPLFRVLRRFLRNHPDIREELNIIILSAKFGLIDANKPIPWYELQMTSAKADEMRSQVLAHLKSHFEYNNHKELFVALGAMYFRVIDGFKSIIPPTTKIIRSTGPQGIKAQELKRWLQEGRPTYDLVEAKTSKTNQEVHGPAKIHGRTVNLSRDQIINQAHKALKDRSGNPENYRYWYVLINGKKVGPKWLISQLTGLPVSDFNSGEARRVLNRLGLKVEPVKRIKNEN